MRIHHPHLGHLRGQSMTIEAQAAVLPAGWYTDPGQSGGKRWWDGRKWTEHLQMPIKAAPASVAARPTANPYGLNGVGGVSSAPHPAMTGETPIVNGATAVNPTSNRAGWLSLFFGLIALGLTVANMLPGSQFLWVSGAGVIATLWGVRGLARLRSRRATIVWAPIIGAVLGVVAIVAMVLGVNIVSFSGVIASQNSSDAPTSTVAALPTTSSEPLVFPTNSGLTTDEKSVQTLATAINRSYAAGSAALKSGQAWPASLRMQGSAVIAPNGHVLAVLPVGLTANYQLSADQAGYHLAVSSAHASELATYSSSSNGFSWSCLRSDANCTPAS
jgi:hypothetical protein